MWVQSVLYEYKLCDFVKYYHPWIIHSKNWGHDAFVVNFFMYFFLGIIICCVCCNRMIISSNLYIISVRWSKIKHQRGFKLTFSFVYIESRYGQRIICTPTISWNANFSGQFDKETKLHKFVSNLFCYAFCFGILLFISFFI